jgi:hypothetical protein
MNVQKYTEIETFIFEHNLKQSSKKNKKNVNKKMTEVVINSNINRISAWYHTPPVIKNEIVEKKKIVEKRESVPLIVKKTLFKRIKDLIFPKFSAKDRAVPVLHIKTVKAKVYSRIRVSSIYFR